MIKIDHIAIYVRDLEGVKNFFETYFSAKSNDLYHNPNTGLHTYILSFGGQARLELMTRPDMIDVGTTAVRNGYIHLSFNLGSKQHVDSLTRRLEEDGYRVCSGPRITGDGYYESCIEGPEGNLLELTI
jgi:lactoylglutathione lyase